MISFHEEFQKSNGKPITVQDVTYHQIYEIKVQDHTHVLIQAESVKNDRNAWKQAVHLRSDKSIRSENDRGKDFVFWFPGASLFHKAVTQAECDCTSNSLLQIWNVWKVDNAVQSLYNGSAMIVTQISKWKWRFQCNDGKPDDDMNDLIFTLELSD